MMTDMWTQVGSTVASFMFVWAMFRQYFPPQLREKIETHTNKFFTYLYPYIQITFREYTGERLQRNEAYTAIEYYLTSTSSKQAKMLKADVAKDSQSLQLSMDFNEEVTDTFQGITLKWASRQSSPKTESFPYYRQPSEKRSYRLTFHKSHRDIITESYLQHVMKEGKEIQRRNRERKLYTNNPSSNWYGWKATKWSHVAFEHPATFETLAMEPKKKEEILKDLTKFSKGKDYYAKIGKAWKRGYLLYGPPGTGKSTMIAAMANFLSYDVYDIELTAVKDNNELRKLLIDITSKSIIVIEDIDCSLDLTGQRRKKKEKDEDEEDKKDPLHKNEEENKGSKVTLSGLLNFIDGLWSACGSERLIIFTTNYVEKLDPALIRRGRMDKHIELSYCCFEAFKALAKNYLDIGSHELFERISELLKETNMTPADVAENLMPKSEDESVDTSLRNLMEALEMAKEEARKKAEEEAKLKEEEKNKEKEQKAEEKDSTKKDAEDHVKCNGTLSKEVKGE